LGRRAVREAPLRSADQPRDRRQGADRRHRRLHRDLRSGSLQRLRPAARLSHLTTVDLRLRRPPPHAGMGAGGRRSERSRIMVTIREEACREVAAREALLDAAYGDCRFTKTPERLREDRLPAEGLSLVAIDRGRIVGTVRLWHVTAGPGCPALLL